MVDVESWWETCYSFDWNGCDLTTGWAGEVKLSLLVSDYQRH
jgi:hypothetical protein